MLTSECECEQTQWISTHQEVIRLDTKQLPEVSEGDWSVSLKPELSHSVRWREVAAIPEIKIHQ